MIEDKLNLAARSDLDTMYAITLDQIRTPYREPYHLS